MFPVPHYRRKSGLFTNQKVGGSILGFSSPDAEGCFGKALSPKLPEACSVSVTGTYRRGYECV